MKQEICSTSTVENGQPPSGRKGGGKRPPANKQPPIGNFHKLGLSVREFVEAAVRPDGDGDGSGSSSGSLQQPAWNGRRNRRETRREKRKLKRGRRKRLLIVNGEAKTPLRSRAISVSKRIPPPPVEEEEKLPLPLPPLPPPPAEVQPPAKQPRTAPSATAATRKRALLAANEAEEREIRRLERQLGFHKRRKKQRGGQEGEASSASLPQSFSRDGLDYVLGALKSEAAFSGVYENGVEGESEGSGTEEEEEEEKEEEEEEEVLSPVEDEVGSSGDFSPEEGSDSESEEGESSQEAAGLAGGFSVFKPADLNVDMAEKQNCQAWRRPEVNW